ncbi:MAG TPA: hypothetical protein PK573_13270, partial [Spirochaetota bacterium]|nr:hypothetical protein [Spirochaetota bacterium]
MKSHIKTFAFCRVKKELSEYSSRKRLFKVLNKCIGNLPLLISGFEYFLNRKPYRLIEIDQSNFPRLVFAEPLDFLLLQH